MVAVWRCWSGEEGDGAREKRGVESRVYNADSKIKRSEDSIKGSELTGRGASPQVETQQRVGDRE